MRTGWVKIPLILFFFSAISVDSFAAQYLRAEGVIHLDTNISGGSLSPEEMLKKVKDAGLKVAIITDHDNMSVEYGLAPLRKILKKTIDKGGIKKYGSKKYIETIEALRRKYPELLILHGAEATPFYYWEGNPIKRNLTLRNWHKHILILGLKTPEDYDNIPSLTSGYPLIKSAPQCIKNLWPLALFILSLILLGKKAEKIYRLRGFIIRQMGRPYFIPGIILLVLSLLFLLNNYPFCKPLFDQYHGDKGIEPYQFLIDYAKKKDALTFWAHPEVEAIYEAKGQFGKRMVKLHTPAYYKDLLESRGYTGFAVFEEGFRFLGRAGWLWDQILKEYCDGKRDNPVWAIGELDYKEGDWMGMTQTVFLLSDFNEGEVLKALKEGRVYAVRGKDKPILEDFRVKGTQAEAIMGEELVSKGSVEVLIKIRFPQSLKEEMKVSMIRKGEVLETFSAKGDFLIKYKDNYFQPGEKIYYRLVVGEQLVTNPIFVRFEG